MTAARSVSAGFISVPIATWSQRFALPFDYCATNPPSTSNVAPVVNDARSDDKNQYLSQNKSMKR
ncbi:hypothetical protein [Nostoc sp. FACHB-888]|uniref:hypothetical protein n=1 Tax=Nostoc sp. FACHB-888 TaxID=2692842 RepID=UPI001F55929C|nr:hypothetical protein [Nostoc sp. FACHB-888]